MKYIDIIEYYYILAEFDFILKKIIFQKSYLTVSQTSNVEFNFEIRKVDGWQYTEVKFANYAF